MYLIIEESFKPSKRQKQDPGDDISDIEHLLDGHPISESTSVFVNVIFGWCCNIFLQFFFIHSPKGKEAKAGWRSCQTTFRLTTGQRPSVEWWHHTAILSRALWTFWIRQVTRMPGRGLDTVWSCATDFPVLGCTELSVTKHCNRKLVHIWINIIFEYPSKAFLSITVMKTGSVVCSIEINWPGQ